MRHQRQQLVLAHRTLAPLHRAIADSPTAWLDWNQLWQMYRHWDHQTPAIRRSVLGVVAGNADSATWDELHRAAATEKTPLVKDQYYDLLASVGDKALAQRALDLALSDEPGATNSAVMLHRVSLRYPDMAFDYALAHLPQVNERVDPTSRSRYFPQLATGSSDPAMIGKVNAYAGKFLAAGSRRDADTAVANIAYRIKVRRERLPVIDAWLAKNSG